MLFRSQDGVLAYTMLAERLLAGQARGEAYNFSNETPVTVLEIATLISRLMGGERLKPLVQNTATNEIPNQFLSAEKARRQLGWRPRYSLEQGMRETIDWYRAFFQEQAAAAAGPAGKAKRPAPVRRRRTVGAR